MNWYDMKGQEEEEEKKRAIMSFIGDDPEYAHK